jgi:DNA repair protein RecO (recombination protein O)
MRLLESEAIVLRTYNLAEADKIVVCLTRNYGLIRAVARGARRLKSRFGAGLEPFTHINIAYQEKEGRELVTLRQAEIVRSHFGLTSSAERVAALSYMSELVLEFAPPHEPNEKFYRMFKASTNALADTEHGTQAILRYFEVWTLRLAGFLPDLRACADCNRGFSETETIYLNVEGKLRCVACSAGGQGTKLSYGAYARLRATQRLSPAEFAQHGAHTGAEVYKELAQITERLIKRVLEREVRSQSQLLSYALQAQSQNS